MCPELLETKDKTQKISSPPENPPGKFPRKYVFVEKQEGEIQRLRAEIVRRILADSSSENKEK